MHSPYIQVIRTYFQHSFSSVKQSLLVLGILFLFTFFFFVTGRSENHHVFEPFHLLLFVVLFSYWTTHLKEQFANSRASLTPSFRRVHGVVATMVAIFIAIFLPGVMAPLIGWKPFGFLSITTLLFGTILWFILRPEPTSSLVLMAGWISILLPPIQKSLEQVACGQKPVQAFLFIAVGAILSITGVIRFILLNEEMPEYHLNLQIPKNGRVTMSDLQWQKMEKWHSRGWRNWYANRPIVKLIYHARHASDSYWSRMHRWNYSKITVGLAFFIAIVVNLAVTFIAPGDIPPNSGFPVAMQVLMATIIPISFVLGLMNVKNRFLTFDLMMPVRRDAYLKQLGCSFAIIQFMIWGVMIAVSVLWMFSTAGKPVSGLLIYATAYSVMIQIWLFGLAIWTLSFRSFIMAYVIINMAIIFTGLATPLLAFDVQMLIQWRPLIMLFGVLLAGIGLLLTWRGYRRWLVADFD